jgi:hypothetical protein
MNPQDNDRKRKAMSSGSESTTSENAKSQKTRRKSFFIYWDKALDVPKKLKQKLRKDRLKLSQEQFAQFEYQLHCIGAVKTKEGAVYNYPATTVNLHALPYIQAQRFLTFYEVLFLCLWREKNKTETIPSDLLQNIFETNFEAMDEDDAKGVVKATKIKINDEHTIQNCLWTVKQRKAVANTRDHFFKDFARKEPMIFDLALGPSTKSVIRDFIVGLWKAKVDDKDIFDMCTEMLGVEHLFPKRYKKIKQMASIQRKSITDFKDSDKIIQAARKIQQRYRQHLQRRRDAIKVIEIAWEPLRAEGEEIRRQSREHLEAMSAEINAQEHQAWGEYFEKIKEDYSKLTEPLQSREIFKQDKYWLKAIAFLIIPIGLAVLLHEMTDLKYWSSIEILVAIVYVIAVLCFITYRHERIWLVLQTIINLTLIAFFINVTSHDQTFKFARLWTLSFVVILGGKKWIILMTIYLLLRNLYSYSQGATPIHYVVSNAFDIYGIITIATASRQGTYLDMLHKLSANLIMGLLAIAGLAGTSAYACFIFEQMDNV